MGSYRVHGSARRKVDEAQEPDIFILENIPRKHGLLTRKPEREHTTRSHQPLPKDKGDHQGHANQQGGQDGGAVPGIGCAGPRHGQYHQPEAEQEEQLAADVYRHQASIEPGQSCLVGRGRLQALLVRMVLLLDILGVSGSDCNGSEQIFPQDKENYGNGHDANGQVDCKAPSPCSGCQIAYYVG